MFFKPCFLKADDEMLISVPINENTYFALRFGGKFESIQDKNSGLYNQTPHNVFFHEAVFQQDFTCLMTFDQRLGWGFELPSHGRQTERHL